MFLIIIGFSSIMMFYVNINYWSHKNRLYITCFLYMLWHYKHICIYTVVSLIYISIKVHGFQFIIYMNFCTKDLSIHFNVMILISLNEHLILLVESVTFHIYYWYSMKSDDESETTETELYKISFWISVIFHIWGYYDSLLVRLCFIL